MSPVYCLQHNPSRAAVGGPDFLLPSQILSNGSHWPTLTSPACVRAVGEYPLELHMFMVQEGPVTGDRHVHELGIICFWTGCSLFSPLSTSLPSASLNAHLSPLGPVASQVLGGRGLQLRRIARREKVQREVPAPLWGELSNLGPSAQPVHLLIERNLPSYKESSG